MGTFWMVDISGQNCGGHDLGNCDCALMLPCLVSLLQRALQKTASAIFLAQIQKGGIVGGGSGSASSLTEEEFNLEDIPVYP